MAGYTQLLKVFNTCQWNDCCSLSSKHKTQRLRDKSLCGFCTYIGLFVLILLGITVQIRAFTLRKSFLLIKMCLRNFLFRVVVDLFFFADIVVLYFSRQNLIFRVTCSKGTYIRSLCADFGKALGRYWYIIPCLKIFFLTMRVTWNIEKFCLAHNNFIPSLLCWLSLVFTFVIGVLFDAFPPMLSISRR